MKSKTHRSYFVYTKDVGVNADIKRHVEREAELRSKIDELESEGSQEDEVYLRMYRQMLSRLLTSKAQVVSKLGRLNNDYHNTRSN